MPKRLIDTYQMGDRVEISFKGETWYLGRVIRHDPPGVWVQTMGDGRRWFVTNTRRIRHQKDDA